MTYTITVLLLITVVWGWLLFNYLSNPIGGGTSSKLTLDYYLSPQVSNSLKGASALLLICTHWCTYNLHTLDSPIWIEKLFPFFGGNFVLVIFLFLSGYGITKSEEKSPNSIKRYAKKRIWKIYKPAFLIYTITALVYTFALKEPVETGQITENWLNGFISDWSNCDINLMLLFKWYGIKLDWYVFTTLVLYVIFYVSYHTISNSLSNIVSKRIIMSVLLIAIYYVIAHFIFGTPLAHYYRNLWAFLLGVMIGLKSDFLKDYKFWIFCGLILLFNYKQEGLFYDISSILALIVLLFFGLTNRKYNINSRFFVYLGGISYYLYLCHRMFYNVLWSYNQLYFPLFIFLSIAFASVYKMIVKRTIHIA